MRETAPGMYSNLHRTSGRIGEKFLNKIHTRNQVLFCLRVKKPPLKAGDFSLTAAYDIKTQSHMLQWRGRFLMKGRPFTTTVASVYIYKCLRLTLQHRFLMIKPLRLHIQVSQSTYTSVSVYNKRYISLMKTGLYFLITAYLQT